MDHLGKVLRCLRSRGGGPASSQTSYSNLVALNVNVQDELTDCTRGPVDPQAQVFLVCGKESAASLE